LASRKTADPNEKNFMVFWRNTMTTSPLELNSFGGWRGAQDCQKSQRSNLKTRCQAQTSRRQLMNTCASCTASTHVLPPMFVIRKEPRNFCAPMQNALI